MSAKKRSPITTHVLDLSRGKAAAGLPVRLDRLDGGDSWKELAHGKTDADGRIEDLLAPGSSVESGTYRLTFETEAYLNGNGAPGFYPFVAITFVVRDRTAHHHVPLLLSPFGYSTYRGT